MTKQRRTMSVVVTVGLAVVWAAAPGRLAADITPTGDYTPVYNSADPWDLGSTLLRIGITSNGQIAINSGSQVTTSSTAFLGYGTGSTGSATVTGSNSLLQAGAFQVGFSGTGYLTVSGGGQVKGTGSGSDLHVGGYQSSTQNGTGTIDVTGTGSQLNAGYIYLGSYAGTGSLTIRDSAQASGYRVSVGYSDLPGSELVTLGGTNGGGSGTLTVSNGGHLTVTDGVFVGNSASLSQYGTGTVNLTGTGSQVQTDRLYVGVNGHGTGTITVGNGASLQSTSAVLGDQSNDSGTVAVTGSESQWGTGSLVVGQAGAGTLTVSGAGLVNASGSAQVGLLPGSTGTVNVTGANSKWTIGHDLYVGGGGLGTGGTGLLTVSNGGLVDVTGDLTVWSTGTLAGNGTVTVRTPTTLDNHGTIAPGSGSTIGTMTVNGNVVFEPGSTYAVKVSPTGSDKLAVNGTTTIDGGTVKVSSESTITGTRHYEIISANSVTGTFNTLDTALLHVSAGSPSLSYDPDSVWLNVTATGFDYIGLGLTRNQRWLGRVLQWIADAGGNEITTALQGVGSVADLRHDYDQLSGQVEPSLGPITVSGTSQFLSTVAGRSQMVRTSLVSGIFDSGSYAQGGLNGERMEVGLPGQSIAIGNGSDVLADRKWGLWGRGYGLFGDRQSEGGVPGYSYHMYGAGVGLDYQFGDNLLGGVTMGTSAGQVDYDHSRDHSELHAVYGGLYGSWTFEKWYVDSVATYAALDNDTERFVDLTGERLTGHPDGYQLAGYIEVGHTCDLAPNLVLQPLAGFQYSYLNFGSYTESGGAAALSFRDQTFQSEKGSLGARIKRQLGESDDGLRSEGQLRGRWVHEFGDNQASVDTAFVSDPTAVFTVHDAKIARDSAVLGAGISVEVTKQLRGYLDYDARLNADETVQVISAAVQYRW